MAALVSPIVAWVAGRVTTVASVLRSDDLAADLGDASYPEINEDRTVEVRYVGHDLMPFAGSCRRLVLSVEIRVAYRTALDLAQVTADDGEAGTSTARLRCADDAAVIREGLLDASTYGSALSNGARVIQVTPGAHTIDDPGEGVLVGILPATIVASYTASTITVGAAMP